MREGPLDMRMDTLSSTTAEVLVNTLSEQEIGKIIREYGEEAKWRTVARRIVDARYLSLGPHSLPPGFFMGCVVSWYLIVSWTVVCSPGGCLSR